MSTNELKGYYSNPEPVPEATQLSIMPFLAGVEGLFCWKGDVDGLRMTVHRVMSREGKEFLQQISGYFPLSSGWSEKVGRLLPVAIGVIGESYRTGKVYRTKQYDEETELMKDIQQSLEDTGDPYKLENVGKSFLSMPFLGIDDSVVLILYAECRQFNFFADDKRVQQVGSMCRKFCRLFDSLQGHAFSSIKNFALPPGEPVGGEPTVYNLIQEPFTDIDLPKFESVASFNIESSI